MPQETLTQEEFEARYGSLQGTRGRLPTAAPTRPPVPPPPGPLPGAPLPPPPSPIAPGEVRDYGLRPPSVSEFLFENVPRSTVELGKSLVQPVLHPIQTGRALGQIGLGGISKLTPTMGGRGTPPEAAEFFAQQRAEMEAPFDAFVQALKDRYGSWEAFSRTAYEDPMGLAADVSMLLTGAGAGLRAPSAVIRGTGVVSRTGRIGRGAAAVGEAGRALRGAARLMDPVQLAAKAGTAGANRALWMLETFLTEGVGVVTGTKARPLKRAMGFMGEPAAPPELRAAMRGKIHPMTTLDSVKQALANMREQRAMIYRSRLAELPTDMALDLQPIKRAVIDQMLNYNISWRRAAPGKPLKLDFSRSTISAAADQTKVRKLIEDVNNWGQRAEDVTPMGVDTLRRRLDDFYAEGGQARAFTSEIASSARDVLDDVPGYREMTRDYSELSDMIKDIETELALKPGTPAGASMRKLMTVFSEKTGYREQMLNLLDNYVTEELGQQIAGLNLTGIAPEGLVGRSLATGAVVGTMFTDWRTMLFAGMSSPRLMGELFLLIGEAKRGARALRPGITVPAKIAAEPIVFRPGAYALDLPPPPTISPETEVERQMREIEEGLQVP